MDVLKSEDVTVDAVNELLNIAGCVTKVDQDGDIFVQEGLDFGVWVIIDRDKKCLVFRTYMRCKQDAPLDELDAYVASLNSKYYLAQFSYNTYENGQAFVNAHYFIFYNFGLIPRQVIFSLRTFAEVFIEAIKISDKDDKFFA